MTLERTVVGVTACLMLMAPSLGAAEERHVRPKAGSFWNYEVTDEIKGNRWINETILTETAENERVLRSNTRGVNNPQIIVYDRDWNDIRNGSTKYEPARTWMPDHLEVGAKSSTEASYSMQRPVSWSDPQPVTTESEVTTAETVTTKAGHFETYRIEVVSRYAPQPENPQTHEESTTIVWFAPRIDHWVKSTYEARKDGHLMFKTSQSLVDYKVK